MFPSARHCEGVHWEQLGLAREVRGRSRGRPLRQQCQTARAHGEISGHLPHLPWRRQETWHDWADSWAWHHWFFGNLGGVVDDMAYFVLVWQRMNHFDLLIFGRDPGCWMATGTAVEWQKGLTTGRDPSLDFCDSLDKFPQPDLVGGLEHQFCFPIYWVSSHPNWLSFFSEGLLKTTNQLSICHIQNVQLKSTWENIDSTQWRLW